MSGSISFNPYGTSSPRPGFLSQTQGYVQGATMDDPSSKMWRAAGTLAAAETLTMWGGVPVQEYVDNNGVFAEGTGPVVARATSQASVTGWSTIDQAYAWVITPGNSVPQIGIRGGVNLYRYGSGMVRLAVQADPALVSALSSTSLITGQALYWDVTNYRITFTTSGGNFALPVATKILSTNTNSLVVNYNAGVLTWVTGSAALISF